MQRNAEENRRDAIHMIQSGELRGYLAYDSCSPVGWANVNDKSGFARFSELKTPSVDGSRICAVTCFVINAEYRRRGIARALLERACQDYAAKGYDVIEAYPVLAENTCAAHYHGHPAMFTAAGFHLCKTFNGFGCMQKYLKETS
jgi:ribosomal protein S18 acetylase RimI-like enzyme